MKHLTNVYFPTVGKSFQLYKMDCEKPFVAIDREYITNGKINRTLRNFEVFASETFDELKSKLDREFKILTAMKNFDVDKTIAQYMVDDEISVTDAIAKKKWIEDELTKFMERMERGDI